jgi:thiamine biosynthesis lipoprotein
MPSRSPQNESRRARPLLGTLVDIRAASDRLSSSQLDAAIDAAFERIELIHRLMSYQDPQSELTRLNRSQPYVLQEVNLHTYNVLYVALLFARLSDGAFNPCVVDDLSQRSTWEDIDLVRERHVRLKRSLRIDLSGIAKGYAVDVATRMLQQSGVDEIVVNAGGDLRVCGTRVHEISLRHPRTPAASAGVLELANGALATSGSYFSRGTVGGREVSALVNPRTGQPYLAEDSVTVRAADCMTADALTKVVLFAPPSVAKRALALCDAHAHVLRPQACGAAAGDDGRTAYPE